jgi:hypothetical protein
MATWIVVYELSTDNKKDVMEFTKIVDDAFDKGVEEGLIKRDYGYDYEFYLKSFDDTD